MKERESELLGIHTGDGSLYRTTWGSVWEIRGALAEKSYYDEYVVALLKEIFQIDFKAKFRSGGAHGCYGVQTSKKVVTNFFIQNGFKTGSKVYTVRILENIFEANDTCKFAFLRGLFDTDGCIRFDRINSQKLHTYPRVEFCFASKLLRDDLFKLLQSLNFRCYTWGKRHYQICLEGKEQVSRWFDLIKPANTKHLNKFDFWLKKGYYPMPRSRSLVSR